MSGSAKLVLYIFGVLIAGYILLHLLQMAIGALVSFLFIAVPVLAVLGVGVLVFSYATRRGLGSGRRRILP